MICHVLHVSMTSF